MAGHSKWANIQHRKKRQDNKRGKLFTKLIREIVVAAKMGGGEIESNPRLRLAVDKALGGNMTRDTINRAIKRGAGGQEGDDYFEIRYEGYGTSGIAVMVDCLTDNRNRTVGEVRHAFTKYGGNLGTDGSVSYIFTKLGVISYGPGADEDKIMEVAIDAGADDVESAEDGSVNVITTPEAFEVVREALIKAGVTPAQAELTMQASTEVECDKATAEKIMKLQDALDDLDDVQEVYTNASIDPAILDEIA